MHDFSVLQAKNLDEAYKLGMYSGSISRWHFMEVLEQYEPRVQSYANRMGRGLWLKGKYITYLPHNLTMPKYTIQCNAYTSCDSDKILAGGWISTAIKIVVKARQIGVVIDKDDFLRTLAS